MKNIPMEITYHRRKRVADILIKNLKPSQSKNQLFIKGKTNLIQPIKKIMAYKQGIEDKRLSTIILEKNDD